jgi:diguanylate cyclase (GGDEF)-like protein/PAS domain S-box-containing protein
MIDRSIGAKILMVVGIAALLSMVGLILFYTQSQRSIAISEHKLVTDRIVSTVVAGLGVIMEAGKADIAQKYAEDVKATLDLEDFRFVRLTGQEAFLDNQTIDRVNSLHGANLFQKRKTIISNRLYEQNDPVLLEVQQSGKAHRIIDAERQQYRILAPIINQETCQHCHGSENPVLGFIQLATSMRHVEQSIAESRNWATLVLFVVLVLFLSITYFLLHSVVISRIRRVTSAMQKVEQGNLNQQVPELSQDELGNMARSFNRMTERLLETYTGLESEQDKLTTIILNAGEGIVVTDKDSQIVLVNPSAEQLIGRSVSEIVSHGFEQLVDDSAMMNRLLEHPDPNYAECALLGDRYLSVMAAGIHTEQRRLLGKAALIRDVTTQKRREDYLEALSFKDELTGLLNRRSLTDVLSQSVADANERGRPLTLLMLDMDHFKQLNDTYGHAMGDRMLKALGDYLNQRLRDSDFACRYGGEEFSVILPGTGIKGGFKTAEDIRQAVSEITIDNVSITISIGLASLQHCREMTVNCLMEAADSALYLAKQQGRNRTVIHSTDDSNDAGVANG